MFDFGVGYSELFVLALIAVIVIGPKDLPKMLRAFGKMMTKARGMARHFRSGFDNMMRESELAEMEQKWKEENERIMAANPALALEAPVEPVAAPPEEKPA